MEEIWFVKRDILVGGTELLIERMGKEFIKRGFLVKVLCYSIDYDMKKRYDNSQIECIATSSWGEKKDYISLKKNDSFKYVITFCLEDFCSIYSIRGRKLKTILYTVYFDQLLIGGHTKEGSQLAIVKKLAASILSQMIKKKNIVCMDEHTIFNTKTYYGDSFSCKNEDIQIVRIPVDIIELDEEKLKRRACNREQCSILTIARADFPWKGYMIGLVRFLNQNTNNEIKLKIVTYGDGEKKICDEINALPLDVKKNVTVQGKTDYDELEKLYDDTNIYVGQGTTVIDAVQRGILSIPVIPDTYDVMSDAFFHEDPTRVTVQNNKDNRFEKLVQSAMNMSEDEYIKNAFKGRQFVKEMYSTKAIGNDIMSIFSSSSKNTMFNIKINMFLLLKTLKRFLKI